MRFILITTLLIGQMLWAKHTAQIRTALEKANAMHLAQSRYWHLLLHMPGQTSEIDDPSFFLSPDGKTNAAAELNATIEALYNETRSDDNATGCLYPARRYWLEKTLDLKDLPALQCRRFDKLIRQVDPQAATLVFSAAHINSPASMFGHTFLRIDSSYRSKMLSHAVNYAAGADPDKENGVIFAIKGLFGGYPGLYSLLPYYEKLKEYRDSEQRNIWEYDLDFTPEQVRMMMRHIWEIQRVYSWYYFFDENCSYNMFWLMEIARPDVHLREHFIYQVIPMETVHVTEAEGLVKAKHFRPSKRSVLLAYEKVLDASQVDAVQALVDGRLDPAVLLADTTSSVQGKRYMLEAAAELAQYRLMKGALDKPTYLKRYHAILSARSTLGKGKKIPIVQPPNPDEGHRAIRVHLDTGWREGTPMQTLGIRPAYHDLSDSDIGFLPGTQIEFLDLSVRWDTEGLAVEKATLLSIVSAAPVGRFFQPFSWRVRVGWDQSFYTRRATFGATVGAGATVGGSWGYVYVMADPEIYVPSEAHVAVKASAGAVVYARKGSKLYIDGGYRFYDNGLRQWVGHLSETARLAQNHAMVFSADYVEKRSGVQRTFQIGYRYYF